MGDGCWVRLNWIFEPALWAAVLHLNLEGEGEEGFFYYSSFVSIRRWRSLRQFCIFPKPWGQSIASLPVWSTICHSVCVTGGCITASDQRRNQLTNRPHSSANSGAVFLQTGFLITISQAFLPCERDLMKAPCLHGGVRNPSALINTAVLRYFTRCTELLVWRGWSWTWLKSTLNLLSFRSQSHDDRGRMPKKLSPDPANFKAWRKSCCN